MCLTLARFAEKTKYKSTNTDAKYQYKSTNTDAEAAAGGHCVCGLDTRAIRRQTESLPCGEGVARYSTYLLYSFKSTNTDAEGAGGRRGTQFTCFISTKVPILTQRAVPGLKFDGRPVAAKFAAVEVYIILYYTHTHTHTYTHTHYIYCVLYYVYMHTYILHGLKLDGRRVAA